MTSTTPAPLRLGDVGTQAGPTRLSLRLAPVAASSPGATSPSGASSTADAGPLRGGASATGRTSSPAGAPPQSSPVVHSERPGSDGVTVRTASASHPDARRAFLLARQCFMAGERIDMGELAAELGVERSSLFRWVGNRDELLSEVLWSLAVPTLNHLDESVTVRGAARLSAVLSGFVDALIAADYFRTFLRREPARALRLLTSKESQMQRRFIAVVEVLVATETDGGYLDLPLSLHDVASLLARMVESFSYSDLLTGEEPSAERARAAFDFVLRP